ncbi:hypothetical protein [Bittarella massiliensis (ex Durand et al. 2017)]|uniref:hypothetical protein n=1 Tax=Bittarella massiliensis (ex Durand et al. 2017) TaxID=1720313 RepID=UPI001AA15F61|nr:hypothetical protein [Bittarella massiliensis (ex Durand et al. 2017)]MBO1680360.1 hypothetical protein [Bittarella massiliensis (ex Durand et al. 2017)]
MARKRMFSLSIIDTDKFMDMSTGAQALYFHLGMHGDDDGFVSSPKKIARAAGCNDDDLRILAQKGFIIPFESGVVVITDWGINNTLKNDRYKETIYREERAKISLDDRGRYALISGVEPTWNQNGTKLEPQHNITEHNIAEQNKEREAPTRSPKFKKPTVEEIGQYCREIGSSVDPERFFDYYEGNGWMVGKRHMKDWKATVRNWERREKDERGKDLKGDYGKGSSGYGDMVKLGEPAYDGVFEL